MSTTPEATAPPDSASKPRRIGRWVALGLLVLVIGALAVPKLLSSSEEASAAGAPAGGGGPLAAAVHVVEASPLVNRLTTTGTLRANESVDLTSEAAGKVTDIRFTEGAYVQAGDLLVKINDADLQAQRARTEFRIRLAEQREERQRQILDQGGISQEEYDLTLNEVNVLRAELDVIDAQIARTEVRAPFAGVVGLRYVSEGGYISPQTRIARLQSLNPLKLDFSVPEKYAGVVGPGDEVTFTVAGREEPVRGTVYAVEPQVDENTRTLLLRARVPNPGGQLLPGAFATVELAFDEQAEALMIPTIAVIPELDGTKVFVLEGGQAAPRRVETGTRLENEVQILSGLAPGDSVLTSGLQQVRPGLPVRVVNSG